MVENSGFHLAKKTIRAGRDGKPRLNFVHFRDLFEKEFIRTLEVIDCFPELWAHRERIAEIFGDLYDRFNRMFDKYEARMKRDKAIAEKIRQDIAETNLTELRISLESDRFKKKNGINHE